MCDACICMPSVSVLFLINSVAKAFTVLILFPIVFADFYSWCIGFCIFFFFNYEFIFLGSLSGVIL